MHNANQILLGQVPSSVKEISNRPGTVVAGIAVCQKSDGSVTNLAADGLHVGISVGQDMSKIGRTSFAREGLDVPIRLTAAFVPVPGTQVHISNTTGLAIASGVGATATAAEYASGEKVGIAEDGSEVRCALINMPGGL